MYRYFSVHFNDILENRKLRSLLNLKTKKKKQIGTHHAYCKVFFFQRITLKYTII